MENKLDATERNLQVWCMQMEEEMECRTLMGARVRSAKAVVQDILGRLGVIQRDLGDLKHQSFGPRYSWKARGNLEGFG